jgi:hypothetical protein
VVLSVFFGKRDCCGRPHERMAVFQVEVCGWRLYKYDLLYFLTQSFSIPCRNLFHKQLTGSIPDTIGNLKQLTDLYG